MKSTLNRFAFLAIFLSSSLALQAKTIRALFLGNSYTQVNDLPSIISNIALSNGDTLIYSSNTPGGYTLQGHSTNSTSLGLIAGGPWDFVILQEQSQLPAFPDDQVEMSVYPYATQLDSLIHVSNPCARTLFYVTWGRKNGDAANCASFPPICTYLGMDSMLQLRYTNMAEMNQAALSPVAMVWRKIRNDYPTIDLYSGDESHPSAAGSFAAACTFYAMMFEKDPSTVPYTYTIPATQAATIKEVAKMVAFDSMDYWNRFLALPIADFTYSHSGLDYSFTNASTDANSFVWDFGDGSAGSTETNPSHTYTSGADSSTITVQLIAFDDCGNADTFVISFTIPGTSTSIESSASQQLFKLYPNPTSHILNIQAKEIIQSIEVIDIWGRIIEKQNNPVSSQFMAIPTSQFTTGTYWLRIKTNKGIQAISFMKK